MEQPISYHHIVHEKMNSSHWVKIKRWDKLLFLLLALALVAALFALFILTIPVINLVLRILGLQIDGWVNFSNWITQGDRALNFFAIAVLTSMFFAFMARFWLKRNRTFYIQSGCPQCGEYELIRVRRWRGDRLLGSLGVPVRRYACRNCTWQGLRLSDKKPKRSAQAADIQARKES